MAYFEDEGTPMVAPTLVWMALPTLVYRGLAAALLPADPASRWWSRVAAAVGALAERRGGRPPASRGRAKAPRPDPFAVLQIQLRLGALAGQLSALEADERIYARARRIKATECAYDDLLAEACHLAGLEPGPDRFSRELDLASRGWSW